MIVFVNLKFEGHKVTNFRRQEHVGMGYIAANLRKHGYQVELINAQFDDIEHDEVLKKIVSLQPAMLGLSLYEMQLQESIAFIRKVKHKFPGLCIVVGGHYASFNSHELLQQISEVDFVLRGEGELSFLELKKAIDSGALINIPGICYRSDKLIIDNGFSPFVTNLDLLPWPVRSDLDRSDLVTNITASRGCHGNCSFCSTNALDKKQGVKQIRIRSPHKVVDEIEFLVVQQHAHHFFFTDDNFMATELIQPGWITQFADEIDRRKLNIVFNFDCRVDDVNKELFAILKKAGLIGVFLGVESASEKTLKLYNKQTSKQTNLDAVKLLQRLRIDYWVGNIMFHPIATLGDIEEDVEFFKQINYVLYFNYTNPVSLLAGRLKVYKGTALYDTLTKNSLLQNAGLEVEYQFQDKKVEMFFDFLSLWKQEIQRFVELDTIYPLEKANESKFLDLSGKLHALSRKYMKIDFNVFVQALVEIEKNGIKDPVSYFHDVLEDKKPFLDDIYQQIAQIRDELV